MLQKRFANIDHLGKMLIQQEKEFLNIYKQQAKYLKKLNINKTDLENKNKGDKKYELENLLNESSSDEDNVNKDDQDDDANSEEDKDPEIDELEDWVDDIEAQNQTGQDLLQLND